MDRVRAADVETIDATLVGHGAVGRPAIELPEAVVAGGGGGDTGSSGEGAHATRSDPADAGGSGVPTGEVLRLVLDGSTRHARFEAFAGSVRATGAYDAPDLARSPGEGENRLREWVEDRGLATGRTVHLDVIEPEFAYGLRAPGEETIYDAPSKPDDSLASIAQSLDGED